MKLLNYQTQNGAGPRWRPGATTTCWGPEVDVPFRHLWFSTSTTARGAFKLVTEAKHCIRQFVLHKLDRMQFYTAIYGPMMCWLSIRLQYKT